MFAEKTFDPAIPDPLYPAVALALSSHGGWDRTPSLTVSPVENFRSPHSPQQSIAGVEKGWEVGKEGALQQAIQPVGNVEPSSLDHRGAGQRVG